MGLIILPIILLAFLGWLLSLLSVIVNIKNKNINFKSILIAIPLSFILYGILLVYWSLLDSMWALEAYILIPIICFIIPSILALPTLPASFKIEFIKNIIKEIPSSLIIPSSTQTDNPKFIYKVLESLPFVIIISGVILILYPVLLEPNVIFNIKLTH